VSVGGDLSLTSNVNNMNVTMTAKGDLTVSQTGALNVSSITMVDGGNISIVADGDIVITDIAGLAGNVSIISNTGSITIGSMNSSTNLVLSAAMGAVTLGSAASGSVGLKTVETDTLSITAKGSITVFEADAVTINNLSSADRAQVKVVAGGHLTVNAAVTASTNNTVSLQTTSGLLTLNTPITTVTGNIDIRATQGIQMTGEADLTSASGNISLTAGSGILLMSGETEINAGSGLVSLTAQGNITLGKIRTTNVGDLSISSGALIDAAEGSVDIIASNARLVIHAVGGIGTLLNPIEIQVARLSITNGVDATMASTKTAEIGLQELDGLIIENITQDATGGVMISTVDGSLLVSGTGI
jgi:hypothetical protein